MNSPSNTDRLPPRYLNAVQRTHVRVGKMTVGQAEAAIKLRAAIAEAHDAGHTLEEIAAVMGVSRGRVWQLLQDDESRAERRAEAKRRSRAKRQETAAA